MAAVGAAATMTLGVTGALIARERRTREVRTR
jgi:hypothetical protein